MMYMYVMRTHQDEPVTIVATGPLSNVAYVLEQHGEAAAAKIKEVRGDARMVHAWLGCCVLCVCFLTVQDPCLV